MRLTRGSRLHLEDLKREDPNQYQDALARLVEHARIYETPGQALTARGEVFEDAVTGGLVSPEQLVKSLSHVGIVDTPEGVAVAGYNNAATAGQQLKGKYKGDISVNPSQHSAGVPAMRVKDVEKWAGDELAAAFVDPSAIPAEAAPNLVRAALMGRAASTGDGAAMLAANRVYDIDDEYVREFLKLAKIGNAGFGSSIRKSGLDDERAAQVIDPATGQRVVSLGGAAEKAFYNERIHNLTKDWLQGGGRGLNDLRDDISIPGEEFQMEHNNPFSKSNSAGQAETPENRVGFLRRYVNSEKGEIDPQEYYQQQRLAYLANQEGIGVTGVMKGPTAQQSLEAIMDKANPVEIVGDRRKKDVQVQRFPERANVNSRLISKAMEPQDQAQKFLEDKMARTIGSNRQDSPGENQDRAVVINSGGGDVHIGESFMRKNGKNGNGH